jgi:hypothetical protein
MGLGVVSGAVAGAAGSTALNAATYLDMIIRGRPASSTPEETVEAIDDRTPGSIPGEDDSRSNRVSGLGALSGIVTGVAVGVVFGVLRQVGVRPHPLLGSALTGLTVMAVTDGAMAKLGVSDLRRLGAADWVADLVPHLTYGAVTWSVLQALQDDRR